MKLDRTQLIAFCPSCMASGDNSSWGGGIDLSHCDNCGHGPPIQIPRWAVESIRQQASWVGKRYYPHQEDRDIHQELEDLRKLIKKFPGRTATRCAGEPGHWRVVQKIGLRATTGVLVQAKTKAAAFLKAHTLLPYVPASRQRKVRVAE